MKTLLIIFTALVLTNVLCQPTNRSAEFEKFKSRFPIVNAPLDTRFINKDPMKIWSPKSNKLGVSECTKFLLKGDSTKAKYKYEKIDMMEGKSLGWAEDDYDFFTVFRIEDGEFILLGFMTADVYSYKCYVSIFSANDFSFVDCVQINQISENGDPYRGVIASIMDKQSIKSFKYEYITEEAGAPHKTKITSLEYKFDFVNKRLLKPEQNVDFSKCSLNDIFFSKMDCADKDPMNKKQ